MNSPLGSGLIATTFPPSTVNEMTNFGTPLRGPGRILNTFWKLDQNVSISSRLTPSRVSDHFESQE